MHAAISSEPGIMQIPIVDYLVPSTFGNLELHPARRHRIHRPAHRLFRRQDRRHPENLDRRHGGYASTSSSLTCRAWNSRHSKAPADDRALPPDLPARISRKAGCERLRVFLDARGQKAFEAGYNLLAVH